MDGNQGEIMCIFSGSVHHVGNTKIFARKQDDIQYLVYSMEVAAPKEVAMILPLPVSSHEEDTVKFINLKGYPNFFNVMEKCFDRPMRSLSRGGGCFGVAPLKVHNVGNFIASFVPYKSSFMRLDQAFRLPANAWQKLPDYRNYGYAVFQLKPKVDIEEIHPMAFTFPSSFRNKLFFPTVHLHDGEFHKQEEFDHELYFQGDILENNLFEHLYKNKSEYKLSKFMDLYKCKEIVLDEVGYKFKVHGDYPNKDILLSLKD